MGTIDIEGIGPVTVSDDFGKLSAEQQQQTANDIARQINAARAKNVAAEIQKPGYLEQAKGLAKQAGLGVAGTLENLAGDIADIATFRPLRTSPRNLVMGEGRIGPALQEATGVSSAQNAPQSTAEEFARTGGEFVGNPLSFAGKGSIGLKVIQALTSAFGSEGLRQVVKGQGAVPEAVASLVGAVLGGKAPSAAARVVTPLPIEGAQAARVQELRDFGVEPTAGDVTGSKVLRRAETSLGNAPGAGGAATEAQQRIGHQVTDAVFREMGEDRKSAETDASQMLSDTRERLQDSFEDVAKKLPITLDKQFGQDVGGIFEDLLKEGLPKETYNRISQQIKNVLYGFDPTKKTKPGSRPVMKGSTYQSLTRKNTPLDRDINSDDPNLSYYATRIRTVLDDAMERTATGRGTRPGVGRQAALEELKTTRRQWYTMLVASKALASAGEGAAQGIITPQRLRALIANTEDNKIQYALQRSNLARLSRAGNAVLTPLPNSNTSERSLITAIPATIGSALGGASTGGWGAIPGAIAGAAAPGLTGRALMSGPVQAYLKNQAVGRIPSSALRSALVSGQNQLPYTPSPEAGRQTLSDLGNFARGGLYGVAKGRGYQGDTLNDNMAGIASGLAEGAVWTGPELKILREGVKAGKTAKQLAQELGRTPGAIYEQIRNIGAVRNPRLTEQQIAVLRDVAPYVSTKEAARIAGIPEGTAADAISRYGIKTGSTAGKPLTEQEKNTILKLFSEGKTLREISKQTGRHISSFRHLLPDVRLRNDFKEWKDIPQSRGLTIR